MKRKALILFVACILAATATVGATLAYFSAQTNEATNTFNFGDVNGELTEDAWVAETDDEGNPTEGSSGHNAVPGDSWDKNPKITLGEDSQDAWIFMKVTVTEAAALAKALDVESDLDLLLQELAVDGTSTTLDTTGWTLMNVPAIDTSGNITFVYGYNTIVAGGGSTSEIFTKITVPDTIDNQDDAYDTIIAGGFEINVKGYLIQADHIDDLDAAYAALEDTILP